MSDAQTLTEHHTRGALTFTCPICGTPIKIPTTVDLLRYPKGATYTTAIIAKHHTCHPKETP